MTELQFKLGDKEVITGWLSADKLGPLPKTEVPQLDLQTVQHIHTVFAEIILNAAKADKSHEDITCIFLGYLDGLEEGLEGTARG